MDSFEITKIVGAVCGSFLLLLLLETGANSVVNPSHHGGHGKDHHNAYVIEVEGAEEAGAAVFAYGRFIMAVINFLIIAWVVFMLVKAVNRMKPAEEEEEAPAEDPGPTELDLLMEIRDALKK